MLILINVLHRYFPSGGRGAEEEKTHRDCSQDSLTRKVRTE